MRRLLALAAFGTLFIVGPAGTAAAEACTDNVNVCPSAQECSGTVNVCPMAHPRDCQGNVDVCLDFVGP